MQSFNKSIKKSEVVCSVCGAMIVSQSPVNDLCKSCFEKEVMVSQLIEYLQTADIKNLNIIQSYSVHNVSKRGQTVSLPHYETATKRAFLVQSSTSNKFELVCPVTVFGRSNDKSDYVIQNSAMSGMHATVLKENESYFILDNNSSNGTWLNDKRLKPNTKIKLNSNDKICFANENMIFTIV